MTTSGAVATSAIRTARRFDHVGINVADLDGTGAWYERAFGLTVESRFTVPDVDLRGMMLLHPSGCRIELLERPGSGPGLQADHPNIAVLTRGYGHICFCVDDVDAAYAELIAAGAAARVQPRPSPRPGARMAWVADPEGNLIELIDRKP